MFKNKYIAWILRLIAILIFTISIEKTAIAQPNSKTAKEQAKLMKYVREGKEDAAIQLAKKYLTSDPDDIIALNAITEAYIHKGNLDAAEENAKGAMLKHPSNPWSVRLLAKIYRLRFQKNPKTKEGKDYLDSALDGIKKGIASNPNDSYIFGEAAEIYLLQGNKDKANEMIDQALSIEPDNDYFKNIERAIKK